MRAQKLLFLLLFLCLPCIISKVAALPFPLQSVDPSSVQDLLTQSRTLADSLPGRALEYARQALVLSDSLHESNSMAKSFNQLGWLYNLKSQYDTSINYYKQAVLWAHKIQNHDEEAAAWQGIGECYMRLFKGDSARFYLNQSLQALTLKKDSSMEAGVYIDLANVYLNENKLEESLDHFIHAAKLYEGRKDEIGLSKALSNLGNIEFRLDNYDKAISYANQAIQLADKNHYYLGKGYCHKLLGWIYRKQNQIQKSIDEQTSAMEIYQTVGSNRDIIETSLSLGNLYYDLTEYAKAITYYHAVLNKAREINYTPLIPYGYSGLSYAYYAIKKYQLSLQYADSLAITARSSNPYLVMDAHEIKSVAYEGLGDYKRALLEKDFYLSLHDSLTTAENRKALETIESQFQNDLKQKEIDQLTHEQGLKEAQLRQLRISQFLTGVALLLVIVIGILGANRIRVVNRVKQQLEIERMRTNLARDLHDDIGSALSSIAIASQLALNQNPSEETARKFESIIQQSTRVQESMSDIVWSMQVENDNAGKLLIKMREFAGEILEPKNISYRFDVAPEFEAMKLNAERRKNFFLIFKEAINNCAKYSACNQVTIQIGLHDGMIRLQVADDGRGFDTTRELTGNGLTNMKARASAMGATLHIASGVGAGTRIELVAPIT